VACNCVSLFARFRFGSNKNSGFGAVPGCIALYYRLTIPETPRYTFDVARDVEKAGQDVTAYMKGKAEGHPDEIRRVTTMAQDTQALEIPKASLRDFWRHYSQWKSAKSS
jgi:PHS family inorganic phosphate transporter-like MFS transporter